MFKITPFSFSHLNFNEEVSSLKKIYSSSEIEFLSQGLYLIKGESGIGKSTFLNLLKGISPFLIPGKLDGEIFYQNQKMTEESFSKWNNDIVYLFQNPFSQVIQSNTDLEFAFTSENLNIDTKKFETRKSELEKLFKLEKVWNRETKTLSNGECQKLVLASLLANSPKVILLDEPTAFLDPEARREFYQILNELKKNHLIVIVDHHLREIEPIADYIFTFLSTGELIKENKNISCDDEKEISYQFSSIENELKVKVQNISFNYPQKKILENWTHSFTNKEIIIIKGENGAGKSTLFKLLAKLIKPTKGEISYFEKNSKIKNIFENVGFVFQNPENSFFYHHLREEFRGGDEELIKIFFDESELEKSPFLFSEGQKRRISILINLILNKKIIFYDEPTFGQDEKNINRIKTLIKKAQESGRIQFIISHDEKFIAEVATKVLILKNGELNETSFF